MWSKLGWKVTLTLVTVALGTIVLVGLLVNYGLDYQFYHYLRRAEDERNMQMIYAAEVLYQEYGDWNRVAQEMLSLAVVTGRSLQVTDEQGQLLFDTNRLVRRGLLRHPRLPTPQDSGATAHRTEAPIRLDDTVVARGLVTSVTTQEGNFSPQDMLFRQTINRSVVAAAILAGLLATAISLVMANRITYPVKTLTDAAKQMGQGNLGIRVPTNSQDELGYLGRAFNEMADNLQHLESLRNQLNADVAHELRTPLTTIQGYVEGMSDGVLPQDEHSLQVIGEEVRRLAGLVDDLQELARAEAPVWDKQDVDLYLLLTNIAKRHAPLFEEKQIVVDLTGTDGIMVRGDEAALSRAIANLMTNAWKYTSFGGRVSIHLRIDGDDAVVELTDTGMGISEKDLPYIFERFYRADQSRARQTGGTGIGLAIASEIIQSHGGRIEVTSKLHEGSTFWIILPVLETR